MLFLTIISLISLAAWMYLALGHGKFWSPLLPNSAQNPANLPTLDIIVPARNEADALPRSLPSLLNQDYSGQWRVILVDDHSEDGTRETAKQIAADMGKSDRLEVVEAPDLSQGWSGKVAAMNAGVARSSADLILFTDADISHSPSHASQLVAEAQSKSLDLTSRMVMLRCETFAERLLIPAFVFFFAMLYPFRRANDPTSKTAAAAGGVMLVRRTILNKIGGMECIKSALIDDCSLAKAIKTAGGHIQLTLTNDAESLRPYPHINDVWQMVARTAYTQLRYSPLLLVGTVIGMAILFLAPPVVFLFASSGTAVLLSLFAYIAMTAVYAPTVKFYGLTWPCALSLPVAAFIYIAATIDSAKRYYQRKGGQWKGRIGAA